MEEEEEMNAMTLYREGKRVQKKASNEPLRKLTISTLTLLHTI